MIGGQAVTGEPRNRGWRALLPNLRAELICSRRVRQDSLGTPAKVLEVTRIL
jgi:hypothetical protein